MARRKRMQYEPPSKRKKRRGGITDRSANQTFLSRRMLIAKGGLVAAFGTLAGRLGYLQIAEGKKYKLEAENNVIQTNILPAERGLIYDRAGRPLAKNRQAWEVKLVVADLPAKGSAERQRILDTLSQSLQLEQLLVIRPSGVPEGSRTTIFQRIAIALEYSESIARIEMARWAKDSKVANLVKVAPLSLDVAARIRAMSADLPGVEVMNEIDYMIGSVWATEQPLTVRKDVPREVAIKLDTNSMYLPGVQVDGSGLAREYPTGEVMSHVLGYVQEISGPALNDLRNRDEKNERVYGQNDFIGNAGLEQALETDLRGKKGFESVEVDAGGVEVGKSAKEYAAPVPGKNVRLTIDLELQQAVSKALQNTIALAGAAKIEANKPDPDGKRTGTPRNFARDWKIPVAGCAVALNPQNGEVLAMVSYPQYDNQLFVTGLSGRKWEEYTRNDGTKAFLNRCTDEQYAPGSTFKIFLAASALANGTITADTNHVCHGAIQVPNTANLLDGTTYACWLGWQSKEHGELSLIGAIRESCDVYFYNVATEREGNEESGNVFYYDWELIPDKFYSQEEHEFNGLGIEKLAKDMKGKFWFQKPTGIEISEVPGIFPDENYKIEQTDERWTAGDSINVSIGQGDFAATPLQIALNTASIAANGVIYRPHLVLGEATANSTPEPLIPEVLGDLDIAQEHIDVVIEGMYEVCNVAGGTAWRGMRDDPKTTKWPLTNPIASDGEDTDEERIVICGKTGTAEYGLEDDLGARDTHAWFTCYAPMEKPEIAVAVIIEAGGEGATYAVPVADAVMRGYFELTGKRTRGKVLGKDPLKVEAI